VPLFGARRCLRKGSRRPVTRPQIYNHECTLCPLHQDANTVCMESTIGRLPAMIVGEAPGKNEDERGEPFVGQAGRELSKALRAAGVEREDFYITNVVKCRPPTNRTPEADEISACTPYLTMEFLTYEPKRILALGVVAASTLIRGFSSMGNGRGEWHVGRGGDIMPTWHPAYVLRQPVHSPIWYQFRGDIHKFVKEVLANG